MTYHTLNGYEIAFPELPEGATDVSIVHGQSAGTHKGMMLRYRFYHTIRYKSLPPGDWQLLKLSEVPEELAGEMVETFTCYETMKSGYKNYAIWSHEDDLFDTARASLTSWVRSKRVEGDCYLLIKKMD